MQYGRFRVAATMASVGAVAAATALMPAAAQARGAHHGPTHAARGTVAVLAAADRLDRKAAELRARATRQRAEALLLREEAAELLGGTGGDVIDDGSGTGDPAEAALARRGDRPGPPPPPPAPPHGDDAGDPNGCGECMPDVAEPLEDSGTTTGNADADVLLEEAADLEEHAAASDANAARLTGHAAKLRERAKALLGTDAPSVTAAKLLERAKAQRAQAATLRTKADTLRDDAFADNAVDDVVVDEIEALEARAAKLDANADRLEARALKLSAAPAPATAPAV